MKLSLKLTTALILILLASPIILLKGCGNVEAPNGATVTINPTSVDITSPSGDVVQNFVVTVKDSSGSPMNGIYVTIGGGFAAPFSPPLYQFYGNLGGNTVAPNDPKQSPFQGETNKYGTYSFSIVIPSNMTLTLVRPTNDPFTAGSGTLVAGQYCYRVSALNGLGGETLASAETCIITAGVGGVNVNWIGVTSATGYRIYGRTTGAELLITTVGVTTTFLDDGSITPSSALPPTDTTVNSFPTSFTDHINASSGTGFTDIEVKFNVT